MRIIDRTRESMGWNNPFQTRRTDQIRKIIIHHSATTGGYHEIILLDGDIELCYVPTTVTNGAFGHNTNAYHICVVGNFRTNGAQPSVVQMRSLMTRVKHNMKRFSVPINKVKGHKELNPTICPDMKMADFRNKLRQSQGVVNSDLTARLSGSQGQTVLGVNFRRGAGTNRGRIRTLPQGQMLQVLGHDGDWQRIRIGDRTGFVHRRYTRI